jgi:serine O-acetyltransferase
MERMKAMAETIAEVVGKLCGCRDCPVMEGMTKGLSLAGQRSVQRELEALISVLFPGCHGRPPAARQSLAASLRAELKKTVPALRDQMQAAWQYQCTVEPCEDCGRCAEKAAEAAAHLLERLPEIKCVLQEDIAAAYEGDPAAQSPMEVVISYPGAYAVMVHRLAHALYERNVPMIPRIMSEYAHSRTGIDIHPGARIGPGFFIDHGTGVVIGETCVIGRKVKLYQGVTLGALSFRKDDEGRLVKGIKRHPNVEDGVVIYGGATILGDVTIGAGSEIGGNVWLTHSVPPRSRVYNQQPRPLVRHQDGRWHDGERPWSDPGSGI